jgi:glycosyltransferase involved in cell wall biosynthesis
MIKILHLITGLEIGGAEIMLYKLVAHADRGRFQHAVVSMLEVGPVGERIEAIGLPVYTLGMRRGVPNPRALFRLLGVLRRTKPDVVQTWLYHADLLGLLGASLTRVPVAWNIRTSFHSDLGPVVALLAKLCARLSAFPSAVVTNSEAARDLHTSLGYRPREWLVIPNGFDVRDFAPDASARPAVRQELGLSGDALLIGFVARFHPQKDHHTFLQAARILSEQSPEPQFVLVGRHVTADNKELRELVAADGLRERVHLLSERADIPRLTAALDIATSSSAFGESFPNVVGEAMACAVPCVVTDVGDAARIVGDTGRVVPPKDAPALALAWRELIDLGPKGRRELGLRARVRVEERYSLDSVVRQYETLYERLAKRRLGDAVRTT